MKKLIKLFIPKSVLEARSLLIEKREKEKHLAEEEKKKKNFIQNLLSQKQPIYLEIGAGEKKGTNGWTTLDINDKCDIKHNLLLPMPFPDNSVAKIYSSHLLEHFYYTDLIKLLKECHRILRTQGEFLVSVPDASIYINAYVNNLPIETHKLYQTAWHPDTCVGIDYVNYIAYMENNHRHLFDKENLLVILKFVGFRNVTLRDFDPTIDIEERNFESIYAKGIK